MSEGINKSCECPAAGFCQRHGIKKSTRQHQICQGVNADPATVQKWWDAWEAGRHEGQTAAVETPKPVEWDQSKRPIRGFGDRVARVTSAVGIKPCGGCGKRQALLNHWFPADLPPIEPVVFSAPHRHLIYHLWPVAGLNSWRWNCDQLLRHRDQFNGRRIVSIVQWDTNARTGGMTVATEEVKEYLRDLDAEFFEFKNDPKLREVVTFQFMLKALEFNNQSDQDITFCAHAKGVRRDLSPDDDDTIYRWTDAMYETMLDRPAEVLSRLERSAAHGTFKRYGHPQKQTWGPWHYTGTFYWFRNRDVFRRNWQYVPQVWFGTEAWPGHMFRPEEVSTIVDNAGDLYSREYWDATIEPQLAAWRG